MTTSLPTDPRTLAAIPAEVIERDYGCGNPSRYVRAGDTVLDLGSGGEYRQNEPPAGACC